MKNRNVFVLNKEVGETPLECLERFRSNKTVSGDMKFSDIPMTYAGRLDPMASGKLLVLVGDECKNKVAYLGLDKEYEVEILFGIETDTQDVLGIIKKVSVKNAGIENIVATSKFQKIDRRIDWQNYVGKFRQKYPAYSSKSVGGRQLHAHARAGTLPDLDEMPARDVEIYSIEEMGRREMMGAEITREAIAHTSKVHGDFRQKEIIAGWDKFAPSTGAFYGSTLFSIIKIRVSCSSGTYMRSLAEHVGRDLGVGAIAYSIHRTKIGEF